MWHTFLDLSQTLSTLTVASAAMERHVILGSSSVISGGAGIEPIAYSFMNHLVVVSVLGYPVWHIT